MAGRMEFLLVVEAMIAEQGETWLETEGFDNRSEFNNAVVVTNAPDYCWRLVYVDGQWQKHLDSLQTDEMAEFFAAFGSHWMFILNSAIQTSSGVCPVRAFIKNGRKRGGFSVSLDLNGKERFNAECEGKITRAFEAAGLHRVTA